MVEGLDPAELEQIGPDRMSPSLCPFGRSTRNASDPFGGRRSNEADKESSFSEVDDGTGRITLANPPRSPA